MKVRKSVWIFLVLALAGSQAQSQPLRWNSKFGADRIEEAVPGRPDLVKVSFVLRKGGARRALARAFQHVSWNAAKLPFTVYTAGSSLGTAGFAVVLESFNDWHKAAPLSPLPQPRLDSVSSAPLPALDGEQSVSWQPLSATYGYDALAVTSVWLSRGKSGGLASIHHFDMAFSSDHGGESPDPRGLASLALGDLKGLRAPR